MQYTERQRFVDQYRRSLAKVRRAIRRCKARNDEQARLDREHLSTMERELLWVLEYIETGHVPDHHKGAYKWTVPVDPHKIRDMVKVRAKGGAEAEWRSFDERLDALMSVLTSREREAFVLVRGSLCSYREAARYMQVRSVGTVANMVRRAEQKLRKASFA